MQPILQAVNITKQFPGTLALDQAQLELLPGEIHAVMGENGAGKSTLMKILSGVHKADAGQLLMDGQPITPANPREALALGIAIVYQELSMVPTLTVAENIFPGHLPTNRFGMVNYRQLYQNAAQVLEKMQVHVNPRALVETLSIANQQLVEISKALSSNCKVLILDEPTSALTDTEADRLLKLLHRLALEGVSILYISHKLNEVFTLAHRITVLRDGRYIGTEKTADVTPDQIIRMMVGRELGAMYPSKTNQVGSPLLEVQDLTLPNSKARNSFKLNQGEILGFAGLIGSGRSELARSVFGADSKVAGRIFLNGSPVDFRSPQDAIKHGLGYLPEDRKAAGLFLEMSIRLNIEAAVISKVSTNGFLSPTKERTLAERYVQQLAISTPGIEQEVRRLSGGNQQKTLVAKWLAIKPNILIVDEPTRGIDVGAKKEIHFLLRQLAESGVGIIIISSELPEILGMSDRILVMHESAIVAEYTAEEATEEKIIRSASGQ
ncbi:MAG: sugar ABC transporter ATP-binding protein [Anaerolineae bacterium]|nr:sugar ABC transporter ATP-binding protein [Anaerolineae bacterium]MBN8617548.1 sugar ABC transporter ATP-binding protein [Anaerolineae bacterium]